MNLSLHRHSTRLVRMTRLLSPDAILLKVFSKPGQIARIAHGVFEAAIHFSAKPQDISSYKTHSCILVDEEVESAAALKSYLETNGATVWTAASGEEALPLIARVRPDFIFLDRKRPGIGGPQWVAKIRQLSPASRLIVLTSGIEEYPTKATQATLRPDASFQKPVRVDEIRRLTEEILCQAS